MQKKTKRLLGLLFVAVALFLTLPKGALALNFGLLVPNLNNIYGNRIDSMYGVIFWLVTVIFCGTELALFLFIFLFRKRPGRKAHYTHGNKYAEITWTVIPVIIVVCLHFYQKALWDFVHAPLPEGTQKVTVQVFAEQFAWNFRYAGPDDKFGTPDDIMTINQLHVPVNEKVEIHLSAKDVIHSFFVPYARIKQDAVPGMMSKLWFELDKIGCWDLKSQKLVFFTADEIKDKKVALDGFAFKGDVVGINGRKNYHYDPFPDVKTVPVLYQGEIKDMPVGDAEYVQHPIEIACAQLCGLGHYRMIGYITIDTPETYDRWMKQAVKNKLRSGEEKWTNIWDKYFPQYNI